MSAQRLFKVGSCYRHLRTMFSHPQYQNNSTFSTSSDANILVSAEVAMIYQSFPFLTIGEATSLVQERIWRHLPPLHRAQALRRSYCRQMYYM